MQAAIIGLGRWGRTLVKAMKPGDTLRFALAYSRPSPAAELFCAEAGLPLALSYEAVLTDPAIDAVVLATPHGLHEAQIRAAAAAGKHVFVEKPIALTRQSAAGAVMAVQEAGLVLATGFARRFHPSISDIRARLADGRLGRLVGLVGQQTSGTGPFLPSAGWRVDPAESPGGPMTAVGIHLLDHMIELAGPVESVQCHLSARGIAHEDTASVSLRFRSGVTGLLFCSISTAPHFNFSVYGTAGLAEITGTDLSHLNLVPAPDAAPTGAVKAPPATSVDYSGFNMMRAELLAFAHSVETGAPYPVPISEVLHGMAVLDAIVASARSNQPERVQQ